MHKILIIEDERKIAKWIKIYLEKAGYAPSVAYDGVKGLEMFKSQKPDLILLDLMIPRMKGEDLCIRIRRKSDVPIIILTAKDTKRDLLNCLDGGADDYMTKPFDPDELVSRINAVLRRSQNQTARILKCGPMEYNRDCGTLSVFEEEIPLSMAQRSILTLFMENPNIIFSRSQLIESAFQQQFNGYERAIDNHIKRIRNLINREGFQPIKTIYGGGYKLEC